MWVFSVLLTLDFSFGAATSEFSQPKKHDRNASTFTADKTRRRRLVTATKEDGSTVEFDAVVRIDTPGEADYYRNGGILQYVLRNMLKS